MVFNTFIIFCCYMALLLATIAAHSLAVMSKKILKAPFFSFCDAFTVCIRYRAPTLA